MSSAGPYPHLRSSPVYQSALRAPSALALQPANYLSRVPQRQWPDIRVQHAGIRLDHLMRNALDPRYASISRDHVSAMMGFLECFERDFLRWQLSAQTRALIEPRIHLCRQIIEQRRQDCAANGTEPPSSTLFRELVVRDGGSVDEVVYDNPVYQYDSMPVFLPPLYWTLMRFWT